MREKQRQIMEDDLVMPGALSEMPTALVTEEPVAVPDMGLFDLLLLGICLSLIALC